MTRTTPRPTVNWALCLAQGDSEAAARWFEPGLKRRPRDFAMNNGAAEAHYRMGNVETALRYWNECLRIDPGNEEVIRQIELVQRGGAGRITPKRGE